MIPRLANGRYGISGQMVGRVDAESARLGLAAGFVIHNGSINKLDGRVRISVRGLFLGGLGHMYALRSRVVWWLRTGEALIGDDFDIHHENTDRTDDCFDNLEKLTHVEHSKLHNPLSAPITQRKCKTCGGAFPIKVHRLKDPSRGQYCGQACYHAAPRSAASRMKQGEGLRLAYLENRR